MKSSTAVCDEQASFETVPNTITLQKFFELVLGHSI